MVCCYGITRPTCSRPRRVSGSTGTQRSAELAAAARLGELWDRVHGARESFDGGRRRDFAGGAVRHHGDAGEEHHRVGERGGRVGCGLELRGACDDHAALEDDIGRVLCVCSAEGDHDEREVDTRVLRRVRAERESRVREHDRGCEIDREDAVWALRVFAFGQGGAGVASVRARRIGDAVDDVQLRLAGADDERGPAFG